MLLPRFLSGLAALPLLAQAPLTVQGDIAALMVDGIHRYLDHETAAAAARLGPKPDAARLRRIIGAVDPRVAPVEIEHLSSTGGDSLVGRAPGYTIHAVRWPVLEGVNAEGLLLQPAVPPVARAVVLSDADQTPEQMAGLAPGVAPAGQWARRLAARGTQVLVPVLIDRTDTWSGIPSIRMTNQPHREWIYRMAFEAGRHIIGYEVQKIWAAVDWFERRNKPGAVPILVAGYGEGGLLALWSAALDNRISAALVSGYFGPRERMWREPIYRDLWGVLREAGDAELAGLISPRTLVVEPAQAPRVEGPPPPSKERSGAAPHGVISTPSPEDVRREIGRVPGRKPVLVSPGRDALDALLAAAAVPAAPDSDAAPRNLLPGFDPSPRLRRQFDELVEFTQRLIRGSPARRAAFRARFATPEAYRDYIWDEVIGRLPAPSAAANPRRRQIYDEEKFRGYEVMLDVWPDVFAYGILLVPKDLRPGERRPAVVCQHGLEGRPTDLADPNNDHPAYHRYAVRLAEEGFVVFAPQNPYIGEDRFRTIQRKAHPLKLALFSFILGQHARILEWLGAQPFVDPARIGFYGLSYGGKTAVRVPPLLPGYALSICSADFNEWVWKTTSIDARYTYMITKEYDMLEFDFANVVNYAELAQLMAPRPFMVERGHDDAVAPDEWVAYEFARVRRHYAKANLADKAEIEFFNGPHTIHGVGTFAFLRRHLGPVR